MCFSVNSFGSGGPLVVYALVGYVTSNNILCTRLNFKHIIFFLIRQDQVQSNRLLTTALRLRSGVVSHSL